MTEQYSVKIQNVSVRYRLSEFRTSSFKEWVINRLRGKGATRSFTAVDNANFVLKKGESLALVGHNGSGKSTLLRVIAGIIPPSSGAVVDVRGRIAPMIELGAGFDGELSGRENIFLSCLLLGLDRKEIEARIENIIDFSELRPFIETPVKNYSSGMYARLGFACTTAVDPDLLIVDEVLAVGDTNFAKKCLHHITELKKRGSSVILVSHDEGSVRRFCDRAIVMNQGKMIFDGNLDEAYDIQREIMLEREIEVMTPEERRRIKKTQELLAKENEAKIQDRKRPKVTVTTTLWNDGSIVSALNLTKAIKMQIDLLIDNPEFFSGKTYFGIEWRNVHGMRISGLGSEPNILIEEDKLKKLTRCRVNFILPKGLPQLCGNKIKMIFAINDKDMTRNIYHEEIAEFETTNPMFGDNEHNDVISFGPISGSSIEWSEL